ncbi:MAG TPA: hypothetical protein VM053_12225 [Gemmatimonadaceae bacterium]|nr:hypothetical protein [Gemmatimonadaceae bacterium]
MYKIVEHPNYANMPATTDPEGKIDWIIPSNRKRGSKNWDGRQRRRKWWEHKARQQRIPRRGAWLSKTAKAIHPWRRKPCQTCGRVMELDFVYPRRETISRLNVQLPAEEHLTWEGLLTVFEVIDHFANVYGTGDFLPHLSKVLPGIPERSTVAAAKEHVKQTYINRESRLFSPGAMANPPDRLDGFHTYNLCCRHTEDTGRATTNLRTYQDDRRAFEQWCEGDWPAANLLMRMTVEGRCAAGADCLSGGGNIVALTADHVGPISLGFKHSPDFRPLCGPCNSAKNRRMTYADVQLLLERERAGESVASWQASFLWDLCKYQVFTDDDAQRLSTLMRFSQHHYLLHLNEALGAGVPDVLLQFVDPSRANEKVLFLGLDPATLKYRAIERTPRSPSYARSKGARMLRIAFDALVDYAGKEKRNVQIVATELVRYSLRGYQATLDRARNDPSSAREELSAILADELTPEDRAIRLDALFQGGYLPDKNYSYVRASLELLMSEYAAVLARRFTNGETVGWDDSED